MIKVGEAGERHRPRPRLQTTALDPVSKEIIALLQQDARRPYDEIARSLGVSQAEVRRRVEDLTERGVIQLVAVTDPLQMGYGRMAMLGLQVDGSPHAVAAALEGIEEVVYVVVTGGGFDVLCEVVGLSDAHLLELVSARIRPIPGVERIHTFLYEELRKQTYTWGVR